MTKEFPGLSKQRQTPAASARFGRRTILRATGVSLALPSLQSLPARAGEVAAVADPARNPAKRRMVCIGNMLGFYPEAFWPLPKTNPEAAEGKKKDLLCRTQDFAFGRSTAPLEQIRNHLTVLEGLDHGLKGGHFAIHALLSGVRQIDAKTMPNANATIDQIAAEWIGGQTRYPSLTIGSESGIHKGCQLSWTRTGTRVPPIPGPAELFKLLFVGTKESDKAAAADRFAMQGSILDLVRGDAKLLERRLNRQDRDKLDEYMTSVREVESRIAMRKNWVDVPKPEPPFELPTNRNMVQDLPLLYDLIALALQTDSTRIATLEIGGDFEPRDLNVSGGYHSLSHHGQRKSHIEALITLETYQIEQFQRFVKKLASIDEGGESLLDRTNVLFGSGMGNANSHTNTNLPIILAGGGLGGGELLQYSKDDRNRPPLTNLFVTMLQQFGMEIDEFATSTGTLRGLA